MIRVANKIILNLIKMFANLTCLCSSTPADSRQRWAEYSESPVCRSLLPLICRNNIGYSRILTFAAEMTVTGGLILFSNRNNRVAKENFCLLCQSKTFWYLQTIFLGEEHLVEDWAGRAQHQFVTLQFSDTNI